MNKERPILDYAQPPPRRKTSWVFVLFLLSTLSLSFGGLSETVTLAGGNYVPVHRDALIACATSVSLCLAAIFISRKRGVILIAIVLCGLALLVAVDAMSRLLRL